MLSLIIDSFSITDLIDPEFYIRNGGIWLLMFIVFAETGLFFGVFFPGDSLIFISGIYSQQLILSILPKGLGGELLHVLILIVLLVICGILGNTFGYWFGYKSGPLLFKKKESFFFKRKYLDLTRKFFDQYGAYTILLAPFFPTVRTFAPIVAGMVEMNLKKFMIYNIIGCSAWIATMTMAGHYLGLLFLNKFGIDLKNHLEVIVIGLMIVTGIPFVVKFYQHKKNKKKYSLNS